MMALVVPGYLKLQEFCPSAPLFGLTNPGNSSSDLQHPVGGPPWSCQVLVCLNEMKNVKNSKVNNIL